MFENAYVTIQARARVLWERDSVAVSVGLPEPVHVFQNSPASDLGCSKLPRAPSLEASQTQGEMFAESTLDILFELWNECAARILVCSLLPCPLVSLASLPPVLPLAHRPSMVCVPAFPQDIQGDIRS